MPLSNKNKAILTAFLSNPKTEVHQINKEGEIIKGEIENSSTSTFLLAALLTGILQMPSSPFTEKEASKIHSQKASEEAIKDGIITESDRLFIQGMPKPDAMKVIEIIKAKNPDEKFKADASSNLLKAEFLNEPSRKAALKFVNLKNKLSQAGYSIAYGRPEVVAMMSYSGSYIGKFIGNLSTKMVAPTLYDDAFFETESPSSGIR